MRGRLIRIGVLVRKAEREGIAGSKCQAPGEPLVVGLLCTEQLLGCRVRRRHEVEPQAGSERQERDGEGQGERVPLISGGRALVHEHAGPTQLRARHEAEVRWVHDQRRRVIVTDRAAFRPLLAGIEMALALRKLYPNDWKVDSYLRLLVNADTLERVKRGEPARDIVASWNAALQEFRRARAEVLLYN